MSLSRPAKVMLLVFLAILMFGDNGVTQSAIVDTLRLVPVAPDSVYILRDGGTLVIGWYPADDSISAGVGSKFFTNWYSNDPEIAKVSVFGAYRGYIDRTVRFEKFTVRRDTIGYSPKILMTVETWDLKDTYRRILDIGTDSYNPGDTIDIVLIGEQTKDTLDLGISAAFEEGVVDTSLLGGPAFFEVDLQDFEGFHIWRGLSPYPSDMVNLIEISKEDAFKGVDWDSIYFEEWPKFDAQGREYYEWVDESVFSGFTYYYVITCFDRGYFKGQFEHNKWDNYICEDANLEQHYGPPDEPLDCQDVIDPVTMTVDAGRDIKQVFAVPNPYRTGTSEQTLPFYHNFPDRTIKFFNVPKEADFKVYTVAGDLVWEAHYSNPDGTDGVLSWDTRNTHGEEIGSGVYIFRCEGENGEYVYGRIIVIR